MASIPRGLQPLKIDYKDPGGNGGQGAVARANATNAAIYANATNAQAYQNALTGYVADETQRMVVTDIKNDLAKEQYTLQMQQRDIQMDSQLQAFKRNQETVAQQLEFNRLAAIRAQKQSEGVYKDRLKAEEFKLRTLNNQYAQGQSQRNYEAKQAVNAFTTAEQNSILEKDRATFNAARTVRNLDFQNSQNNLAFAESFARNQDIRDDLIRRFGNTLSEADYNYEQYQEEFNRAESAQLFQREANDRTLAAQNSLKIFQQEQLDEKQENLKASKEFESESLGLAFDRFEAAKGFEKDSLDRQLSRYENAKDEEIRELEYNYDEFDNAKTFEKESLDRQLSRFKAAKDYEKAQALIQYEDKRAQSMFQTEARLFQRASQLGQQLARGQSGRSAARGLRSISAMAGIDLARLNDQMDRAYDVYNAITTRADAEKSEQDTDITSKKTYITSQVNRAKLNKNQKVSRAGQMKAEQRSETNARKLRIGSEITEQETDTNQRQSRIAQEIIEARDLKDDQKTRLSDVYGEQAAEKLARNTRSKSIVEESRTRKNLNQNRLQQRLDESRQESVDKFNQSFDADMRERTRILNLNVRNRDLQMEAKVGADIQKREADVQAQQKKQDAKDRLNLIAETTGLKAEVFNMDRRAIGESVLSAASAYDSAVEDIWLKKYEGDVKTYANRMFEPKFVDAPKAPFQTPSFPSIPPSMPIEVPRGSVAPRPEAPKQSGLSKVLQIGAIAVGALAAPLTAGGSLGWAAAATAASGAFSVGSAFT